MNIASLYLRHQVMNGYITLSSDLVDHKVEQSQPLELIQMCNVSEPTFQYKCIHDATRHSVASVQ